MKHDIASGIFFVASAKFLKIARYQ